MVFYVDRRKFRNHCCIDVLHFIHFIGKKDTVAILEEYLIVFYIY